MGGFGNAAELAVTRTKSRQMQSMNLMNFVGWVKERSDEPTVSKAMGIAALNPSYISTAPRDKSLTAILIATMRWGGMEPISDGG